MRMENTMNTKLLFHMNERDWNKVDTKYTTDNELALKNESKLVFASLQSAILPSRSKGRCRGFRTHLKFYPAADELPVDIPNLSISVGRSVGFAPARTAPHKTVTNLTSLVETVIYTILNLLSLVETQKMSALIGKCALTNLFSYFYYENYGVPLGSKLYYQCDTLNILRAMLVNLRTTLIILRAT